MTKKVDANLLDAFLGEYVVILLRDVNTQVQTEEGAIATIPLVAEGEVLDYNGEFIMLSIDNKQQTSLVSLDSIVKIDTANGPAMNFFDKPSPGDYN
jgi:hypothetical protein